RFGAGSGFYQSSSGRVTALAVDPCDSTGNTAYLGGAQGGVWKTTNGGTNWTPLTDSQASLAIGSIAVVGTPGSCSTSIVYVGTGEQSFSSDSYYGAGILRSSNGGTTWTLLTNSGFDSTNRQFNSGGAPGMPAIGALSIQPGNPNVVLAAVESTSP